MAKQNKHIINKLSNNKRRGTMPDAKDDKSKQSGSSSAIDVDAMLESAKHFGGMALDIASKAFAAGKQAASDYQATASQPKQADKESTSQEKVTDTESAKNDEVSKSGMTANHQDHSKQDAEPKQEVTSQEKPSPIQTATTDNTDQSDSSSADKKQDDAA